MKARARPRASPTPIAPPQVIALAEEAGDDHGRRHAADQRRRHHACWPTPRSRSWCSTRSSGRCRCSSSRASCRPSTRPSGCCCSPPREASPDLLRQARARRLPRRALGADDRRGARRRHRARRDVGAGGARALRGRRPRARRRAHRRHRSSPSPAPRAASAARPSPCTSRWPPPATTPSAPCAWPSSTCRPATCARCWTCRATAASPTSPSVAEGEITARSLDDTLYVHSTGLRVLLAPERGEDGEDISASAARQILGALKFQYDIVVCDVGSVMTEAGAVAVEMASNVLVVTTPDVPAIRAANRLLRLWERLQIDTPARILLNRTSREHEIQPDFARRVLQAPVLDTTLPVRLPRPRGAAEHRAPRAPGAGRDQPRAGRRRRGARGGPRRGPAPAPAPAPRRARRDRPDDGRDARRCCRSSCIVHPRARPDAGRGLHVDGDQPRRARRRARLGRRRQQGLVDAARPRTSCPRSWRDDAKVDGLKDRTASA